MRLFLVVVDMMVMFLIIIASNSLNLSTEVTVALSYVAGISSMGIYLWIMNAIK